MVFSLGATTVLAEGEASSGNTCVYVLGTINGQTVTTPAIPIVVPENGISISDGRVHVDPTTHEILGYSLYIPGISLPIPASQGIFVPGQSFLLPSFTTKLLNLFVENNTCFSYGVETPAIPIKIPQSSFEVPGSRIEVPEIHMNILGEPRTVGGEILEFEGRRILIPGAELEVPPQTIESPDATITMIFDADVEVIKFMNHRN